VLFDTYIIVDWSASRVPKTGRDSIWVCRLDHAGEKVVNPPTRNEARALLAEMLSEAMEHGKRVVAGFDFPFGYPSGFAARLGLSGTPWRATWDEIARLVEDHEDNRNNRFLVGAELNRRVSGKPFPFWGCPAAAAGEFLGARHHRGHVPDEPLQEHRLIDRWMTGAQPCWKLAYTGSVGSQALTGIPVVRALRNHPRWADHARIWPFETGLRSPEPDTRIVFAEVWPSWWRDWRTALRPGDANDQAQVRHVAGVFAGHAADGTLAALFGGDPSLTPEQRAIVEGEEAWTLGVMQPRPRKVARPAKVGK
jgi:hypothetical protein